MQLKIFYIFSLLLGLSYQVQAQSIMLKRASSMSNEKVWEALTKVDSNGTTKFGKCKVDIAAKCKGCFCPYYFKANVAGSLGYFGWPKNPQSGDSTGCLGRNCWGGYSEAMCTSDVKANAKAMLLDALAKNACQLI